MRRKEREAQQMDQVREEERRSQSNLQIQYQENLEEQGQAMKIAVGLLGDARYNGQTSKKRRRNEDGGDAEGGGNVSGGARGSNQMEIASAPDNDDSNEQKAEESVRENLLALSYAMFDTLYGTESFDPRSFVTFLARQGEISLAEEIGLAALEKSHGDPSVVRFILNDLVPKSNDAEELARTIERKLSASALMKNEGKNALVEWQVSRGNTKAAFQAALLLDDEFERVNKALPLATTEDRKRKLKESCCAVLSRNVIGIFEGDDWYDFVLSRLPATCNSGRNGWKIHSHVYINHAATSMETEKGTKLAGRAVLNVVETASQYFQSILEKRDNGNPYPKSGKGTKDDSKDQETCMVSLVKKRDEVCDLMFLVLSGLEHELIIPNSSLQRNLDKLSINTAMILAKRIAKIRKLPTKTVCVTSHKHFRSIFGCKDCRAACVSLSIDIGVIRALRRHSVTSKNAPFLGIGFQCKPSDLLQFATVGKSPEMPIITERLLGNDMSSEQYCKSMIYRGENEE